MAEAMKPYLYHLEDLPSKTPPKRLRTILKDLQQEKKATDQEPKQKSFQLQDSYTAKS